MKWDNDKNKDLKYKLLDFLIFQIPREYGVYINLSDLSNSVDIMIDSLIPEKDFEDKEF